jgi:hypothetical protein
MSMQPDQYDDDDEQEPAQPQPRELRAQIKALNAELAQAREQAERTANLERENAFFKADLPRDLNEAKQKAIMAIAGDTTPEAFRQAAQDLGYIEPPAPTVPAEELAAHDRAAAATAGTTGGLDPANYDAEVAAAATPEELRGIMAKYGRTPEIVE